MRRGEISAQKLALLLLLPSVLLILFTTVYPVLLSAYLSTFDVRGLLNRGFVGWENYRFLLSSGRLQRSFIATLYFGSGTIVVQLFLAMAIALALNVEFWGRNMVRALILIPWAIPTSLVALMWLRFLASTDGYVNGTLRLLGLLEGELTWLSTPTLAIIVVILVDTWKFVPIFVMIFLAGLQAIPQNLYEAAAVEGASGLQTLRYITLPLLKPLIAIVIIMRTIFVFQAFDIIYLLTGGGPGDATRVLTYYAYQEGFGSLRYGRGAAVAFILFGLTALLSFVYIRVFSTQDTVQAL